MTFGERLTQLRKEHGYSTRNEFADKLGIPSTTLRNYETDAREPGHTFLKQISEFFNVSVDYLLCLTDDKEVLKSFRLRESEQAMVEKYRNLDNHGKELVGLVFEKEHERCIASITEKPAALRIYTYMQKIAAAGNGFYFDDIPTETIEAPYMPGADFIIGVSGDSMEPTYNDGDLVYVEKRQIIHSGEIGIFMIHNECYIKEVTDEGLKSHNPKYKLIPGDESIHFIGKVLGMVDMNA